MKTHKTYKTYKDVLIFINYFLKKPLEFLKK